MKALESERALVPEASAADARQTAKTLRCTRLASMRPCKRRAVQPSVISAFKPSGGPTYDTFSFQSLAPARHYLSRRDAARAVRPCRV